MILVKNKVNSNSYLIQNIGKNHKEDIFSSILDIPDSYKNFEKIVSYNESEGSTKIMECSKCINMKKAGRHSSMKNHFHGLRGLGRTPTS